MAGHFALYRTSCSNKNPLKSVYYTMAFLLQLIQYDFSEKSELTISKGNPMAIEWTMDLTTGVNKIDTQRKELIKGENLWPKVTSLSSSA